MTGRLPDHAAPHFHPYLPEGGVMTDLTSRRSWWPNTETSEQVAA